MVLQDVQDHGGDGRFSMRATDDHPRLVLRVLVQVFRIRINAQSQFLGFSQFRTLQSLSTPVNLKSTTFGKSLMSMELIFGSRINLKNLGSLQSLIK